MGTWILPAIGLAAQLAPAAADIVGGGAARRRRDERYNRTQGRHMDTQRNAVIKSLLEDVQGDPYSTGTFKAGQAQLRTRMEDRGRADAAGAAARGATGGEFEIAQQGARTRGFNDANQGLMQQAGFQRRQSLAQLLGALGQGSGVNLQQLMMDEDRKRRMMEMLGQGAYNFGSLLGGSA